jgi:uncharacterized protein (TIGR02246 family)
MKAIATGLFVSLGMLAISGVALANDQADEQSIRAVVAGFAKSWNLPGMPGFGDLFTKDADFVVITGRWLKGRDAIVKMHRDVLADLYKGSQFFVDATTIRFLRSDIAVVHSDWHVMYTKDGKELKRTTLAVLILAKAQGQWKIATVHNTLTGGPGWSFADSKWIDRSVPSDSHAADLRATP